MYQVILIGVREDVARAAAAKNLATLFNATPEQVEKMLANSGYVLKKGIAEDVALKYKAAIEAAGGTCRVEQEISPVQKFSIDIPPPSPPQEGETAPPIANNALVGTQKSAFKIQNWMYVVFGVVLVLIVGAIFAAKEIVGKHDFAKMVTDKFSGNSQQMTVPPKGTYQYSSGSVDITSTWYPDGAYIDVISNRYPGTAKSTPGLARFGRCQQNGDQLLCRQTGAVILIGQDEANPGMLLRVDPTNPSNFQATNFEGKASIKMNANGGYTIKLTKQNEQFPVDAEGYLYVPMHIQKDIDAFRSSFPAHYFLTQHPADNSISMPSPAQQNPLSVQSLEAESKISSDAIEAFTDMYGGAIWKDKRLAGYFNGKTSGYVTPVFEARFAEDGIEKLLVLGYITPETEIYACESCIQLLGGAIFLRQGSKWVVESSQKIIESRYGRHLEKGEGFSIIKIGPTKHGVWIKEDFIRRDTENFGDQVLVPSHGKLDIALDISSWDDGSNMGSWNEGSYIECKPGVDFNSSQEIKFEPGKNPEYFDAVVRARNIHGDCEQWSRNDETTRYRFDNGKYEPYK